MKDRIAARKINIRCSVDSIAEVDNLIRDMDHIIERHCDERRVSLGKNIAMLTSLVADISDVPLDRKITLHTKMPLDKNEGVNSSGIDALRFTLLPGLLFRKQVRGPDLSSRKQAPASDPQFRRQAQESDLSFRKRRLQPFRRTLHSPPFKDSVYILP